MKQPEVDPNKITIIGHQTRVAIDNATKVKNIGINGNSSSEPS
jgi:hypothetical protein